MKKHLSYILIFTIVFVTSCINLNWKHNGSSKSVSIEAGSKYVAIPTQTFAAKEVQNIKADLVSCDLKIVGDAQGSTSVTVSVNGSGVDNLSMQDLQARIHKYYNLQIEKRAGGELFISVKPKLSHIGSDAGLSFKIQVHTAQAVSTKVDEVSGDVSVANVASADVSSVSGDIELTEIQNQAQATSVSGDIKGNNIGTIGNINSTSGNIIFTVRNLGSNAELKSVSGDISLTIPTNTALNFDLSSVSGDLNINSINNKTFSQQSEKHIAGQINNGGKLIEANTVSGDIEIKN